MLITYNRITNYYVLITENVSYTNINIIIAVGIIIVLVTSRQSTLFIKSHNIHGQYSYNIIVFHLL